MRVSSAPPPTVVIVAYGSDEQLPDCLAVLGRSDRVLVVDNEASATTRGIVERAGASYLASPSNIGFARAVNLAAAQSDDRGDILLLNPDARISFDEVLVLQRELRHPSFHRAAVGPTLRGPDGSARAADWPMPSPGQVWVDAVGLSRSWRGRRFVTGAVLLLRAEAIAEIGLLDERYFLYAEEADWQLRAQRAGWSVAVVPQVTATHVGGASSSVPRVRESFAHASARAFYRRWYGRPARAGIWLGSVAAAARRSVRGPAAGTNRRALWRHLVGTPRLPTDVGAGGLHVVHVVRSDGFAGVESSVATVAAEQGRRGHRVTVIGGDQQRIRSLLPAEVDVLPGNTLGQVLRSLWSVGRVDVVHAHMTAAETAVLLVRHRLRGRFVATRHFVGVRGSSPLGRVAATMIRRALDVELATSEYVAAAVGRHAAVVHHGTPPSVLPAVDRERTVVVLQRLEPEKNTSLAVEAWARASLRRQGWRLLVHGAGSERQRLESLAHELDCADSVEFGGWTTEPRSVLARAGALLAPTPVEAFGLSVVEAMAEGTPVLAADAGAHREVLGPDGCYFPAGDAVAAAMQLDRLATIDAAVLGGRLRARHAERFSVVAEADALDRHYRGDVPRVGLLSLEPWDDVWRRNQHLAAALVSSGAIRSLVFANPPRGGWSCRTQRTRPHPGIEVVTPPLIFPRRYGGHRILAVALRWLLRDVDVVWVNDPVAGAGVVRGGRPAVYDVTDDWRELDQPERDRSRLVAAEDALALTATTIVCSPTLRERWRDRYRVDAALIGNGVDLRALAAAVPVELDSAAPHVVYIGTVHPNRIDLELVCALAAHGPGTLHLVGPYALDASSRADLEHAGVRLHGLVAENAVPSWLVAADVLVCPHRVNAFTSSLDAIKAYEYLGTGAPVVATPTSGFQGLAAPGLSVVDADEFVAAVRTAAGSGPFARKPPPDWSDRARSFAAVLHSVASPRHRSHGAAR